MDLILVHLGPNVPSYMFDCIKQIRKFTEDRIVVILSERPNFTIREENVLLVCLDMIPKCENWKNFKPEFFAPMGGGLWRYSCERFFAIESVMKNLGIKKALHIENDNLIYAKPDEEFFEKDCGDTIGLVPITYTLLGAGIMYIGSIENLDWMNGTLNCEISKGKEELEKSYGNEMLNEMRLLNVIRSDKITALPILPCEESKYVYDCASWGQYVGGTHQNPGKPHSEDAHIVGREINAGKYCVEWETPKDKGPFVFNRITKEKKYLFNLHIHSKELHKWMSQ